MRVEQYGEGSEAYFGVHGWAGGHLTFRRLARHTPEGATFYSADLPGYGSSPEPDAWTVEAVMERLIACIAENVARPVTLVGNCGGALLALEAVRISELPIKRIVMIDPFAYPPLYFRIFTWGEFGRRAYFSTFASPLGRRITNGALWTKRSGRTNLTAGFTQVNHEVVHRYLSLLCSLGSVERYKEVAVPVHIAYGEKTFRAVKKSVPMWQEALPDVRATMLRGAGHEPIREATGQLAQVVFHPGAAEE